MARKKQPSSIDGGAQVPRATRLTMPADLVPHPRYGAAPRYTRLDLQGENPHFEPSGRFDGSRIIRGTAIKGRSVYYDILKVCVDCRRHFIFHAVEQQHWYEDLGFAPAADCIRCVECRKLRQAEERSHTNYQRLLALGRRTLGDYSALVEAAVDLHRQGKLKSFGKVRALLNDALSTHPDRVSQSRIEDLREQIRTAEQEGASDGGDA